MKIHSVKRIQVAIVDTNIGEFKVYQDGTIYRWDAARIEFCWFNEDKFDAADITLIREAAFALLN